ncbi:NAD(P)-dependent dehydrogenase (short-subunit alcohol dehydrogenase family) [Solirubrobacter pauli]|uniref:NAD(P)-dependent dehydrogenase (Short-subunit alcohol dehydrogenase family) n=2 Tax=Solirubrobacter pauli TaxID=166793 RepID=A0A660L9F3_9ACTN|nr:NAD(P)-dependent dehydrogenase (short-subunit alcohol dehydrogenase family) [Solirubrobacter pauli]
MIASMGVTRNQHITVVTGGARGIGAAVCTRLAADGHDVVIGFRAAEDRAEAVAEAVRAAGARAVTVRMDTADPDDVDRLFDAAAELGPVTGLVNNAGIVGPVGRLVDLPVDELPRVYAVNVVGVLLCARRAARDMLGRGGVIVNISSGAATLGSPNEYVHYAGSKAAVDAITVGLAKELGPDGIRVNCVAPGTIWTEIHADPERPAKVAERVPLGRAGEPEEIAGAVAWLLSDDASYTTGAILRVAGGM